MTNDEKKELLCALIDGKTLQYSDDGQEWHDCQTKSGWIARDVLKEMRAAYRIKPETVVKYLVPVKSLAEWCWAEYEIKQFWVDSQIKLTWEGDKLISAEVIEWIKIRIT